MQLKAYIMKIVVTGGIGSGKSNVATLLAEKLEYTYISVDEIIHDLYADDTKLKKDLNAQFGTDERKLISDHVFKNPTELARLEELFMPYVEKRLLNYEEAYADLIVEFPLYFEKGSCINFDVVVSVTAHTIGRIARVIKRDKITAEKVRSIMDHQVQDTFREANSDYVIENNLGLKELEDAVDALARQLIMRKALTEPIENNVIPVNQNISNILSKLKNKSPKKIGLVSGSFDPITLGHTWVIQKALDIVDEVVVAVAINHSKKQLFSPEERGQLITDTLAECLSPEQFARVTVNYIKSDEMTVSYANHVGAKLIFRGLRNSTDFEYENQLNLIQKKIAPEIETILLMTPRELIEISSSLIKGALSLREWERIAEPYVSKAVLSKLREVANK
jgi:pantetheine-phosphate adenylyltransferase